MRRKIYIPDEVRESIQDHVAKSVESAQDGYLSANEDEDTMTGHLGALLKIKKQRVSVVQSEINGEWKWSIDYCKFRGRGPNATEKLLGADGILELKLNMGFREEMKSVLFQSKMDLVKDANLAEQCVKMSTWREAAFVLNFTPTSFEAFSIDDLIRSHGKRPSNKSAIPLARYLSNYFVECLVGDSDLSYDARSRRLQWRTIDGEVVATKFSTKHRIAVKVEAPKRKGNHNKKVDRVVPNDEIHKYRMEAREEEILAVSKNSTKKELKAAKRAMSLTYHPDSYVNFGDLAQEILKRRMQEINNAYDFVERQK